MLLLQKIKSNILKHISTQLSISMKKTKTIQLAILIIFLLAILSLLGYLKIKHDSQVVIPEVKESVTLSGFETKHINISDDYTKIDIEYPYFPQASKEFNEKIETLLKEQIKDQQQNAKDNWLARVETATSTEKVPQKPAADEDKFPLMSTFTVVQANDQYVSYVLTYSGYEGGAHGYAYSVSGAYDVKNQKEMTLKDLFSPGVDYLKYVSETSRTQLIKEYATPSQEDSVDSSKEAIDEYASGIKESIVSGTEEKDDNFSVFTFASDNKLKIYFQQYQVGPYVLGMPEVEMDRK